MGHVEEKEPNFLTASCLKMMLKMEEVIEPAVVEGAASYFT